MLLNRLVRPARLFLLVLLGFAVPLMGYAGAGVPQLPCPMQALAVAEQQLLSNMDPLAMESECCNDMETRVKTGATCKVGQECQICALGLSVPFQPRTEAFRTVGRIAGPKARVIEPRLANIWRPPA